MPAPYPAHHILSDASGSQGCETILGPSLDSKVMATRLARREHSNKGFGAHSSRKSSLGSPLAKFPVPET